MIETSEMILPSLCLCYCCYRWRPCCWWRILWWRRWPENVRYARGSRGLLWSGRTFHSGGMKTRASRRRRALLHSASYGTGSPSDWKSELNNPVCGWVRGQQKRREKATNWIGATRWVSPFNRHDRIRSIFWGYNKSAKQLFARLARRPVMT